ncbi:MAG TPA: hypothetical protein VGN23_16725 [Verrucomicrobiae bacterium]|jgi:hypothetical protein
MSNIEKRRELLKAVWKFHSVLNIIWPKPGVPVMAGSSTFIGTGFFRSLETGIKEIDRMLISFGLDQEIQKELCDFWHVVYLLYLRLKVQKRLEKSVQVDDAINLLYLASGVLYNRIKEISFITIELAPGLSDVEDIEKLLYVCNWGQKKGAIKEIENNIMSEMRALLEKNLTSQP